MNFIDVCFKSNIIGTKDTYKCETTLYGITDEYEEHSIVTFIYDNNGLTSENYNISVTHTELNNINSILINKYNDYCLSKVKVK